jgi:hypothetical protein
MEDGWELVGGMDAVFVVECECWGPTTPILIGCCLSI